MIHRDIKPENILLHDGRALVADFGIALAASKAGGSRMTETGMSLGTPHYMSPEQAMGEREITARSDVYALGAVTYEMLVGEPPFTGPHGAGDRGQGADRGAAAADPAPALDPAGGRGGGAHRAGEAAGRPVRLGRTSSRRASPPGGPAAAPVPARAPAATAASPWRRWLPLARWRGVALAGRGAISSARAGRAPAALPMTFGSAIKVTWDPGIEVLPAISPDGKTVAYASGTPVRMRVFVRPVAGGRGIALTDDTTQVQSHPRWSPDGSRVLFLERGGVVSVPATGGAETAEVPPGRTGPVISAAWAPDGKRIAYVVGDSVFVREPGGDSRGIARVFEAHGCAWSPDAEYLACSSGNAIALTPGLAVRQRLAQPDRERAGAATAGSCRSPTASRST